MTARQVYEALLIECNKVQAPSILLEDYNYIIQKAINQWINKRYNVYDYNQQTTDDLAVLKATQVITMHKKATDKYPTTANTNSSEDSRYTGIYGAVYEAELPLDYYHILNCVCEFVPKKNFKCYDKNYPVYFTASRLTSDMWGGIINNHYMRPMYKRPYYYIHNVNTPKKSSEGTLPIGTNGSNDANTDKPNQRWNKDGKASLTIGGQPNVERTGDTRYGNQTAVRIEIRYGADDTLFELKHIYIDYLKVPKTIRLTQNQLDKTEDTSQILEFPDYVVQEIINEAVMLIMENASDQRLQTFVPVSQSIAQPQSGQASAQQ